MAERDPFDLNTLRADPADPSLRPKGATTRRKAGWQKQFIRFPWSWMDRLRATNRSMTYRLALLLVYEHWRTGGRAIALSNTATKREGISSRSKWYALCELEQMGLIAVERRPRRSPLVHLLVSPGSKES
jgi:hypothetical protein